MACGFEHYPANAYALPLSVFALAKDEYSAGIKDPPNFADMLWKNLIPCTLGNLFAGVVIMSMGMSFFFGSMKAGQCFKKKEPEAPKPEADAGAPPDEPAPNIDAVKMMAESPQSQWVDAIAGHQGGFARTVSC